MTTTTTTGRHTGSWSGAPATGRGVSLTGTDLVRIADARIADARVVEVHHVEPLRLQAQGT